MTLSSSPAPVLTADDAGCWIDGHWGQYAVGRLVEIAVAYGFSDLDAADLATRHLASISPSDAVGLTDDEHERLVDAADDAEAFLNTLVPDGFWFGWDDGEFLLVSEDAWGIES